MVGINDCKLKQIIEKDDAPDLNLVRLHRYVLSHCDSSTGILIISKHDF